MPEPELHVRDLTPPVPGVLCDSGRHIFHPGDTCEEVDELQAAFRAWFEHALADAYEEAARLWLTGSSTGEAYPADEVPASLRAWIDGDGPADGVLSALHCEIDQLVNGNGTGKARGFLGGDQREATPMERALAILDPHLRACPLYRPGPARIVP